MLLTYIQRNRGRNHHQHHGAQDADVGKAGGVFAHAVKHAGDGDEMGRLVVKALVGPEHLEQGDGTGAKQRMGSENDQEYGHKEVEAAHPGAILLRMAMA